MRNITFAGLACLVFSLPVTGASRIWLTPLSTGIQSIQIQAAPGTRLRFMDGIHDLGTVQTSRSGVATLAIRTLSSGPHTLRAVKWGTGESEGEPLSVVVPARPMNRLSPSATYPTGIHADFVASGDLQGNGWQDLILGSATGISLLPIQDGVPGHPQRLDRVLDSSGQFVPTAVTVIDANGDGRERHCHYQHRRTRGRSLESGWGCILASAPLHRGRPSFRYCYR